MESLGKGYTFFLSEHLTLGTEIMVPSIALGHENLPELPPDSLTVHSFPNIPYH